MIAAIVPAKALDDAKTRLAELLTESERRRLALAMLTDVVRALRRTPEIDRVAVVSPDSDVLEHAEALGVTTIREPAPSRGLNSALDIAREAVSVPEVEAVLVVLADVPALSPEEIKELLAFGGGSAVLICPSSPGGTSALLLRPPDAIPFRFGPKSMDAHIREAIARGLPFSTRKFESLVYDIDEPGDLLRLMDKPQDTETHRFLESINLVERMSSHAR